ncbi:MAG: transposase [Rhizonema sp. PD37]|nr:transposase [Rhizonema sp. PD37]
MPATLRSAEWEIFEPLLQDILPMKKQTRPTNWTKREIFLGILYQLKNGCNWQDLPKDLRPYRGHPHKRSEAILPEYSVRKTSREVFLMGTDMLRFLRFMGIYFLAIC